MNIKVYWTKFFKRLLCLLSVNLLLPNITAAKEPMPFDASLDSEPIPEVIDYNFHVRPILSDNCFVCHGPDAKKQKANLRLDIADHAYAPLEAHPELVAIAPGDLKKSHAYQRIISDDPAIVMPPPDAHLTLSKREKAIIAQWITDGAKYDDFWAFKTVPEK